MTRYLSLMTRLVAVILVQAAFISAVSGEDDPLTVRRGLYLDDMKLNPIRADNPKNISMECKMKLLQTLNISSTEFKALDAFGRPGAGLTVGNLAWLGNYDECLTLEGENYCLVNMQINPKLVKGNPLLIRWGVCVPDGCSTQDIQDAVQDLLGFVDKTKHTVTAATVTCDASPVIPYSAGVIGTIILLSVLALLMIIATSYDEYLKLQAKRSRYATVHAPWYSLKCSVNADPSMSDSIDDDVPLIGQEYSWITVTSAPQGVLQRFLLCFAVSRNLPKLLDTSQKDTTINCLSMTWVILAHTLVFAAIVLATNNIESALDWLQHDFGFQAIANGFFSVDSFFFLSGFLLAYLALSRMQEMKTVKAWAWFYFHRYWRLTPALIVTILLWMYIQPFIGRGPLLETLSVRPLCEKYWWTNLLYINNFYPQGFGQECVGWTWYLANDMQFFIISPLLLIPLYYAPVFGWILLVLTTIVSMVVTGIIIVTFDLGVSVFEQQINSNVTLNTKHHDYGSLVYVKPYCRIAPYLVGLGLGFIFFKIGKRKVTMSPLVALVGWILAAVVAISVLYGLYPSSLPGHVMTEVAVVLYGSVSRFFWAIALCWVVYACRYGYGGWINNFLSWKCMVPLSRLTYSAYLLHPLVLTTFYACFGTSIYLSKYLTAFYFVGATGISYFAAALLAMSVEYPFANMEKLFMPNNPKEKQECQIMQGRFGKIEHDNGLESN